LAGGGSAVVEHSPHHPKVKDLSPAIEEVLDREKKVNF